MRDVTGLIAGFNEEQVNEVEKRTLGNGAKDRKLAGQVAKLTGFHGYKPFLTGLLLTQTIIFLIAIACAIYFVVSFFTSIEANIENMKAT
jgi:hypothetical protein